MIKLIYYRMIKLGAADLWSSVRVAKQACLADLDLPTVLSLKNEYWMGTSLMCSKLSSQCLIIFYALLSFLNSDSMFVKC